MLEVAHVSKHYATPRGPLTVLSDVSVSLSPGQAAAITGPSGSGKSSLLYVLGALEPPSAGTVTLGGTNPFTLGAAALADFRNAAIGFVFQDHCLLPQCSVLENVLVPTLVARQNGHGTDGNAACARAHRAGRARRSHRSSAGRAVGRRAAARGDRARARSASRTCCCATSRPAISIHAPAETVAALLLDLHARQQNILIVVTHNAALASQFPIRFELADQQLRRVA